VSYDVNIVTHIKVNLHTIVSSVIYLVAMVYIIPIAKIKVPCIQLINHGL